MLQFFLSPFCMSFFLGILILVGILSSPMRRWGRDRKRPDRRHLSRIGGVALLLAFVGGVFLEDRLVFSVPLIGFLIGCIAIVFVGLWDDIRGLTWRAQMAFQVALSTLLFIFGVKIAFITNPLGGIISLHPEITVLPGFLVLLFWTLMVVNAVNWLDGIDGLCGSVSVIALATIFFLSLKPEVSQPPVAILAALGIGAVAAFLLMNLPPARIMGGTVGSLFLGFLLTFLSVMAGTKIATALLVLSVPVADAVWVIGKRLREGRSLFEGDTNHIHHQLKRLGWSEKHIVIALSCVTGCVAFLAVITETREKAMSIVIVGVLLLSLLFVLEKKVDAMKREVNHTDI